VVDCCGRAITVMGVAIYHWAASRNMTPVRRSVADPGWLEWSPEGWDYRRNGPTRARPRRINNRIN